MIDAVVWGYQGDFVKGLEERAEKGLCWAWLQRIGLKARQLRTLEGGAETRACGVPDSRCF